MPRPGAGRVHQHAIEDRPERQRARLRHLHEPDVAARRLSRTVVGAAAACGAAARRRPRSGPVSVHVRGQRRGLAAGRRRTGRARVRRAARRRAAARAATPRPGRRSGRRASAADGLPAATTSPSGAYGVGVGLDCPRSRSARLQRRRATSRSRLARSVSGGRGVVERGPSARRALEAVAIEPARHQPVGMRVRDAEIGERLPRSRRAVGPRRQRQPVAAAASSVRSTRVDESRGARLPRRRVRSTRRPRRPPPARDRDAGADRGSAAG